jgi:hypothetical protein
MIGAVGGTASAAPNTFVAEVASDRPLAHWRLDETQSGRAADRGPHGLDGTYVASMSNGLSLGQPTSCQDRGVGFSGGGVVVPSNPLFDISHVTAEGVVSWAGPNGQLQRIVERSVSGTGGTRAAFALMVTDSGHLRAEISAGNGNSPATVEGIQNLPTGQYLHLAMSFDGASLRLYVNGRADGYASIAGQIAPSTDPVVIGNQEKRSRPFNGVIDEVVLFDHALSQARIAAHGSAAFDRQVPLRVHVPKNGRTKWSLGTWPVQLGVPLPEWELFDPRNVSVRDVQGNSVPHQTKVLAHWRKLGDGASVSNRSIKWLQLAYQPNLDSSDYFLRFGGCARSPFQNSGVTVSCTDAANRPVACTKPGIERAAVNTGTLSFTVSRANSRLVENVKINGIPIPGSSGALQGLYFKSESDTFFANKDGRATLDVEEDGPEQATLKATGTYVNQSGVGKNRWIVRIKAYRQKRFVRIYHTIVFSESSAATRYTDIGVAFPMPRVPWPGSPSMPLIFSFAKGTPYVVAADLPEDLQLDDPASACRFVVRRQSRTTTSIFLGQDTHNQFVLDGAGATSRQCVLSSGAQGGRIGHWMTAREGPFSFGVAMRWAWQNYPLAYEMADDGTVRLHLWSRSGRNGATAPLDFRPGPYLRGHTPDRWQEFQERITGVCDRKHEYPSELEFCRMTPKDSCFVPTTAQPCGAGTQFAGCMRADGVGVSKTHEFILSFDLGPSSSGIQEAAFLLQKPAFVQADPSWLRHTEALGKLLPAGVFPDIDGKVACSSNRDCADGARECHSGVCDSLVDTYIRQYQYDLANDTANGSHDDVRVSQSPADRWGDSFGAFDFGDTLHQGKNAHRLWSHLFYVEPSMWWTLFARSGDRRLLSIGEANARHHMDVDTNHISHSEADTCNSTSVDVPAGAVADDDSGPIHWANRHRYRLATTSHFASYLATYYYLTGYERARDVAVLMKQWVESEPTPKPADRQTAGGLHAVIDLHGLLGSSPVSRSSPFPLEAAAREMALALKANTVGNQIPCAPADQKNLSFGQETQIFDFSHAYTLPALAKYALAEQDPSRSRPIQDWLKEQVDFISDNNLHSGQGTYFNYWTVYNDIFSRTNDSRYLRGPMAELERIRDFGAEDISAGMVHRVWLLQNLGYLLDGLSRSNGRVTPQPELDASLGEIQMNAAGPFEFKVRAFARDSTFDEDPLLKTISFDPATGSKIVLYGPGGNMIESRAYPDMTCSAAADAWYKSGAWIEKFVVPSGQDGVYRVRIENGRFWLQMLSYSGAQVMYSGAADGYGPWRHSSERLRRWVYAPGSPSGGSGGFHYDGRPNPYRHSFEVGVVGPNRQAIGLQIIGRDSNVMWSSIGSTNLGMSPSQSALAFPVRVEFQLPSQAETWGLDLGPGYDYLVNSQAPRTSARRSISHVSRRVSLNGLPPYLAMSPGDVFRPQVSWPPRLLKAETTPGGSVTLSWLAEVGADDYALELAEVTGGAAHSPCGNGPCLPEDLGCKLGLGVCKHTVSGLQAGQYEWRVTSQSSRTGAVTSATSAVGTFTIQ